MFFFVSMRTWFTFMVDIAFKKPAKLAVAVVQNFNDSVYFL